MLRRVLLIALSTLVLVSAVHAQDFLPVGVNAEHNNKRYAGRVTAVAPVTLSTILIGTDGGGVWKTTDGGLNWEPKTDRERSLRISAIAASPNGTRVYAATYDPVRLLRSTDSGETFTESEMDELLYAKQRVFRLLIDPDNEVDPLPGKDTVYAMTTRGLWRSRDNGSSWYPTGPMGVTLTDVAILHGTTCRQFWATDGTDLYTSTSGIGWLDQPLPPPDSGPPITPGASLVFAHQRPYKEVGIYFGYSGAGDPLYDGGIIGICNASVDYVGRHPDKMVRGGAATYTNSGSDIVTTSLSFQGSTRLAHLDAFDDFESFPGPYPDGINAVVAGERVEQWDSSDPRDALYVATDRGLWRKVVRNNADDWDNLNGNLANLNTQHVHLSKDNFRAPIADGSFNGVMAFRGVDWKIVAAGRTGDVFLRNDDANRGGAFQVGNILQPNRFIRVNNGIPSFAPLSMCSRPTSGRFSLDPTDPSDICVADGDVRCSADGGNNWCVSSADFGAEEVVVVNGQVIWARTSDNKIKRTQTGVSGTWDDVTSNLPSGLEIVALTASPAEPHRAVILGGTTTSDVRAYQTIDEGTSWQIAGIPPVPGATTEPPPEDCVLNPCPQATWQSKRVLSFGISYHDPNFPLGNPERWYVGTTHGLVISDLTGNSWYESPDVPRSPVEDIDASSNAVAVATAGRGVWVYDNIPDLPQPVPVDCDQWCHIRIPLPLTLPWASWLVALSNDDLAEVIDPRGGRVYRRGETPFGNTDFLITPGAPLMAYAESPVTMMIDGYPDRPNPIHLKSGWNTVGIPSNLTTSLEAVADAAAQGITIEAVMEGVTPPAGRADHIIDFDLSPTTAYWVFVCGDGGVWMPGAGSPAGP